MPALPPAGHDCSVRLWMLDNRTCVQEITAHRKKHDEAIHDVAFHPSQPFIASAGADALAKIFIWQHSHLSGELINYPGHTERSVGWCLKCIFSLDINSNTEHLWCFTHTAKLKSRYLSFSFDHPKLYDSAIHLLIWDHFWLSGHLLVFFSTHF